MQRYLLAFSLLLSMAVILSLGNSGGAGAVQGADRTGSPLSNGFCGNCHSAGAFNPTISLALLDEDANPVTQYQLNEPYTLQVTINADAEAAAFGFQSVALAGAENKQAGTFGSVTGTQVTILNDRQYAEQSTKSSNNTWSIPWTSPADDMGEVRFYAAGNAVNDNGTSGGDGADRLINPLSIASAITSTNGPEPLAASLNAFPNPVINQTNIELEVAERSAARWKLYDHSGRQLRQADLDLFAGENRFVLDMNDLPAGHYLLEISNESQLSTLPLLKQ